MDKAEVKKHPKLNHPIVQLFLVFELARAAINNNMELHKMFIGEYEYKIDEKGRLPIPPKFRNVLKDGVVLTPGPEKCVNMYSLTEWKKLADSLTAGSVINSKMRRLNRAIFATAFNLNIDGQGRVALPATLREYARIEDEVVPQA